MSTYTLHLQFWGCNSIKRTHPNQGNIKTWAHFRKTIIWTRISELTNRFLVYMAFLLTKTRFLLKKILKSWEIHTQKFNFSIQSIKWQCKSLHTIHKTNPRHYWWNISLGFVPIYRGSHNRVASRLNRWHKTLQSGRHR